VKQAGVGIGPSNAAGGKVFGLVCLCWLHDSKFSALGLGGLGNTYCVLEVVSLD